MRPQMAYVSARHTNTVVNNNFGMNHNTVRYEAKPLGRMSFILMLLLIVLGFGLIYVSQGNRAINYDYELSRMEDEITELEAKKEDLAVESARITSINAVESSKVASSMEDGGSAPAGYAD